VLTVSPKSPGVLLRGFGENTSITFPSWKAIFLVCGLLTSVCGFGLLYFLPDSPITAKWLSQEERRLAVERLRANQQGIGSKVFKWYQVREAFTDIRVRTIPNHLGNGTGVQVQANCCTSTDIFDFPILRDMYNPLRRHNGLLHTTHSRIRLFLRRHGTVQHARRCYANYYEPRPPTSHIGALEDAAPALPSSTAIQPSPPAREYSSAWRGNKHCCHL